MSAVYAFQPAPLAETTTCCNCGVEFASPVIAERRTDGGWFYCPNGHRQHYTKTEEVKLREDVQRLQRINGNLENTIAAVREDVKWARADAKRAKTVLRKTRERVKNGVCPCCNRGFQNLKRHMNAKHPKFAGEK